MVGLGFEPWAAIWKAQTNPLIYGGPKLLHYLHNACMKVIIAGLDQYLDYS